MKINAANERIKHEYFEYLEEARQLNGQSVDAVAKALARFEVYTNHRDFKAFHREQAIGFKKNLAAQLNVRSGEKLSKPTVYATLNALKAFFFWLAGQPGYKSKLQYGDSDFFNLSRKDSAIAKARREQRVPTMEQIRQTLNAMPDTQPVDKRNRALVALNLLACPRADAMASMRIKHIDFAEETVIQDARQVRTKNSKTFPTFFFPVGEDIIVIVRDWVRCLTDEYGFGPNDPLFPPVKMVPGKDGNFVAEGFQRTCWSTSAPVRAIFKQAFATAGLPYFNPHSFRKTLTRFGMKLGIGDEAMKAWSQNLGHEDIQTTLRSYGDIPVDRQRELIRAAAFINAEDKLALELGRKMLAAGRMKD